MSPGQRVDDMVSAGVEGKGDPKGWGVKNAFRVWLRQLLFDNKTTGVNVEKAEGRSTCAGRGCDNCMALDMRGTTGMHQAHHLYTS